MRQLPPIRLSDVARIVDKPEASVRAMVRGVSAIDDFRALAFAGMVQQRVDDLFEYRQYLHHRQPKWGWFPKRTEPIDIQPELAELIEVSA